MKANAQELVLAALVTATRWVCVSEIAAVTGLHQDTINRRLRRLLSYPLKSQLVPGDRYRRKQWAVAAADTTGWANSRVATLNTIKKAPPASAGKASKPSYGGFDLMCVPLNKPSLIKAVGDLVTQEFIPAQKKFSAHDVTKRLREKVLAHAKALSNNLFSITVVEPDEVGTVFVHGIKTAKVEHEDVKAIVHELYQVQAFADFGRAHVGTHWEYDLVANLQAAPTATSSPTTPPPSTNVVNVGGIVVGVIAGDDYDGSSTI